MLWSMLWSMLRSSLSFIFTGRGQLRQLEGKQLRFVRLFALITVLFHLVMLSRHYWGIMHPLVFLWLHVGLIGALTFLIYSPWKRERRLSAESVILAGIMLAIIAYFFVNMERLLYIMSFHYPGTNVDAWIGWLLIILIFEGVRRTIGLVLPLLVLALAFYGWLVSEIPLHIYNQELVLDGPRGVWGLVTSISATIIVPVLVFAGIFQASGTADFLIRIVGRLLGRTRGAAAKMAVLASAGFGTVSGGAPTNVAVTGVVTIPAMIRSGFKPAVAGAIESVASTGGAITPPVMAGVVFIMAALTGTSYASIVGMVLPVVIIFYLILFLQSHWIAVKEGIGGIPPMEPLSRAQTVQFGSVFFVPIIVLVAALVMKYSMQTAFLSAIVTIAAMILLTTRGRGWRQIIEGIITGGYNSAYIIFILILSGVFMYLTGTSGLDWEVIKWSRATLGGAVLPTLVLAALISLILGMSGSVLAAYVLVIMLVIPIVVKAGIPVLPAHMFAFYFAVMSYITPPICAACFIATRFCNASYWRIGWESIKLALPLWILPFVFVYRPELLLMQGSLVDILTVVVIAAVGMILLAAAVRGMLVTRIGVGERLICLIAGALLLWPLPVSDLAGGAITGIIVIWEVMKWARRRGERISQPTLPQQ